VKETTLGFYLYYPTLHTVSLTSEALTDDMMIYKLEEFTLAEAILLKFIHSY